MTSRINLAGHLKAPGRASSPETLSRFGRHDVTIGPEPRNERPLGCLDVYPDENEENLMSGHVRNFLTAFFLLLILFQERMLYFRYSCLEYRISIIHSCSSLTSSLASYLMRFARESNVFPPLSWTGSCAIVLFGDS